MKGQLLMHCAAFAAIVLACMAHATRSAAQFISPDVQVIPVSNALPAPYAGKYEARMGSAWENNGDKLRLDIGASMDLIAIGPVAYPRVDLEGHDPDMNPEHGPWRRGTITIGSDFFTWTRLRGTSSFKFPVEAVDYYFGLNGTLIVPYSLDNALAARVRVAHISAHMVDGDPSFTDPRQQYFTYSREFVDASVSLGHGAFARRGSPADRGCVVRPYVGALVLFHTIPDTLGRVTPYVGIDGAYKPQVGTPLTLRWGYELRVNTELATIVEHQVRLGVKFARPFDRGITLEAAYYHGRSHYGQHFGTIENYTSVGFAIDL